MIEPRCPGCVSPETEPDPEGTGRWRCGNCGGRFDFESALIRLGEAEDLRAEMEADPLFHLHRNLARIELRACDGELRALNPHSDVEELHRILDAAMAHRVIEARRPGAALHAYLLPGAEPHPVLGVDPGVGAELIGPGLALPQEEGEDPISYTVRRLGQMVDGANDLLPGRPHAAGGRPPAADLRAVGPRSHRPASRRGPVRCTAVATWLDADIRKAYEVAADGPSLPAALAGLGERIEAGDPDSETLALGVTLSWEDAPTAVGGEEAR